MRGSKFGRPSLLRVARAFAASRRVDGTVSLLRAGAGLRSGRVARSATNFLARVSGFSEKVFLNAGFSPRGASVRGRSERARSLLGRSLFGRSLRSAVGREPRGALDRGALVRAFEEAGLPERGRSKTGTSTPSVIGLSARGLETFDSA